MASGDDDDPFWRVSMVNSARVLEGERDEGEAEEIPPKRGAASRSSLVPAFVPACGEGSETTWRFDLEVFDVMTGVGGVLWTGALVLSAWLVAHRDATVKGRRVLELGAGVGLVGLAVARAGAAETVLTDCNLELVEGLASAIRRHGLSAEASAAALDWFDPEPDLGPSAAFDVIVGAEVIYSAAHGAAVVQTVDRFLCSGTEGRACILTQTDTLTPNPPPHRKAGPIS